MSSSNSPVISSPINNGTVTVQLAPHTVSNISSGFGGFAGRTVEEYQTISAQEECADFSLEELRLVDYKEGHAASLGQRDDHLTNSFAQSSQTWRRTKDKKHSSHLALLIGPAIEIQVGTATPVHGPANHSVSWSLPKRLISHHSPFLEAACNRNFKELHENLIRLPKDDPAVFALFVEWLYYGDYSIEPTSLPSRVGKQSVSIDAECWVLGDKLLCTDFKDYAIRRLYKQHTNTFFSRSIATHDVQFACDNSAKASKLRQLYVDLAATNFGSQDRVQGTVEEWDILLLNQPDLRKLLLQSLRLDADKRNFVKSEEHYLEDIDVSL